MKLSLGLWILATLASTRMLGSEVCSFEGTTTGSYPRHHMGTVMADGARWRIAYLPNPDAVEDLSAIISGADGKIVALNEANHTWFYLKRRNRFEIDNSLFTFSYGQVPRATKVTVKTRSASHPDGAEPSTIISFSYQLAATVAGEKITGSVWGTIEIWTGSSTDCSELPWKVFELSTGLEEVDVALRAAASSIKGVAWKSETKVSRQMAGGAVLQQTTTRLLRPLTSAGHGAPDVTIPKGYTYQETVYGVSQP